MVERNSRLAVIITPWPGTTGLLTFTLWPPKKGIANGTGRGIGKKGDPGDGQKIPLGNTFFQEGLEDENKKHSIFNPLMMRNKRLGLRSFFFTTVRTNIVVLEAKSYIAIEILNTLVGWESNLRMTKAISRIVLGMPIMQGYRKRMQFGATEETVARAAQHTGMCSRRHDSSQFQRKRDPEETKGNTRRAGVRAHARTLDNTVARGTY